MAERTPPELSLSAWQVIQAMPDGVVLTDPVGSILAVNRAFCAVTGYAPSEVVGRNPRLLHSGRHDRAFYRGMWGSIAKTGHWQGEIWNRRKNGEIYPEWLTITRVRDAWGSTRCFLGVFRDITNPKLYEERLKELAQQDALTGLPNRRLFRERLARVAGRARSRGRAAVLFIDIDRFKEINDARGHAAGDALLQAVGARLRGCVRRTDLVARWAGDEFVVLLSPIAGPGGAARVARKILGVMRRPFSLGGRRSRATVSIGGCMVDGRAAADLLVARADRAMYAVKKRGRDSFSLQRAGSLHRRKRPRGGDDHGPT